MLNLKDQVVQKVSGLSEENMQFILDMIERFIRKELGLQKGSTCMMMITILMR